MQFDQSQMCVSVRDPGGETWDIVLLRGLARAAHLSSVCVRVVLWDMLHRAERKSVGMCVCSITGMKAERCFTSLHTENKSLYQYMIC